MPRRGYRDGSPTPDPLAPRLSYHVAATIHRTLVKVASDIRWGTHRDPEFGKPRAEPEAPEPDESA